MAFTVEGADSQEESVAPVAYDANRDGDLPVDENGEPSNDFGVGGVNHFVDVVDVEIAQEQDTNAFGTDHMVTATLVDGSEDPVALDGQQVTFEVGRWEGESSEATARPCACRR